MPRRLVNDALPLSPNRFEVERLVRLPFTVPLDFDRDRLRRLAGGKGQRAGLAT